jgi:hypothetical protein
MGEGLGEGGKTGMLPNGSDFGLIDLRVAVYTRMIWVKQSSTKSGRWL